MKLSTRTRYGTRMLIYIASQKRNRPVPISEISRATDVSVKYLEQLLILLRHSGLVKSVRGAQGGFLLARAPYQITVGDAVRVLENGIALAPCIENPSACSRSGVCKARGIWGEATEAMFDVFDSLSLANIVLSEKLGRSGLEERTVEKMPPVKKATHVPESMVFRPVPGYI